MEVRHGLLGETAHELGGSEYYRLLGHVGASVPRLDPQRALHLYRRFHRAARNGLVSAAHDCSDGGLAVALAESAFAGDLGMTISLKPLAGAGLRTDALLFAESNVRLVVTVPAKRRSAFERLFRGLPCTHLGAVTRVKQLHVSGVAGEPVIRARLRTLKQAWQKPLDW